ncbi:hypothetical protein BH10PSE19_BH10PSE19_13230 [soil metagenome]
MMKFGPNHPKWDTITATINAHIATFLPLDAEEKNDEQKQALAQRAEALMQAADGRSHPLLASHSGLNNHLQNPLNVVAAEDDIAFDRETALAIDRYTREQSCAQLDEYRRKKNHESNPHHIGNLNEPWIRARKDSWLTTEERQQQRFDAIKVTNIRPYVESLIKPDADAPLDQATAAKLMKLFEAGYDETDEKADLTELNEVLCQPKKLYESHIESGNLDYNESTYKSSRSAIFSKVLDELDVYDAANKDKPNKPEGLSAAWLAEQRAKLPQLVARTPFAASPVVEPVMEAPAPPAPVVASPVIDIAYEEPALRDGAGASSGRTVLAGFPVTPSYRDESDDDFFFTPTHSHALYVQPHFPITFVTLVITFEPAFDRQEIAQNVSNILLALAFLQVLQAISQQQQVMSLGGVSHNRFLIDGPTITEHDASSLDDESDSSDTVDLETVATTPSRTPVPLAPATPSWKRQADCRSLDEIRGTATPVAGAPTLAPGPRTAPVCRL